MLGFSDASSLAEIRTLPWQAGAGDREREGQQGAGYESLHLISVSHPTTIDDYIQDFPRTGYTTIYTEFLVIQILCILIVATLLYFAVRPKQNRHAPPA